MKAVQIKTLRSGEKPDAPSEGAASPLARWVGRFGVAGFAFFFIKGLLWLLIPALLAYMGYR